MEVKNIRGFSPGLIISSSVISYLMFIAITAVVNYLFHLRLIPVQFMGIVSKTLLFLISSALCAFVKKRVREDAFVNCITAAILFCTLTLLTSLICTNGNINIAGVIICVLLSITGCLLLFIKNNKYSKMHKKRYKRQR